MKVEEKVAVVQVILTLTREEYEGLRAIVAASPRTVMSTSLWQQMPGFMD